MEQSTSHAVERAKVKRVFAPKSDVIETPHEVLLFVDIPGVPEKSVDVTLEKSVLTIRGSIHWNLPENQNHALGEFGFGDYERIFTLSDEIDREKIEANVKNGVLKLRLPKVKEHLSKKVAVRVE